MIVCEKCGNLVGTGCQKVILKDKVVLNHRCSVCGGRLLDFYNDVSVIVTEESVNTEQGG